MTILEDKVWVTLSSRNVNYYERLNYLIPKRKDKWGNYSFSRGTEILVNIKDLPDGSHVKVTKVCDNCKIKIPNQKYQDIIKVRNNGVDLCSKCNRIIASKTRTNNVKYEKSLEHWAKQNNKEYLLDEFSQENIKKTNEVSYGSKIEYLWKCRKCNSTFTSNVNNRTNGKNNCPYCAGQRVNHTNCLATVNPELANEWHPTKNGELTPYNVTKWSNQNVWWLCQDCKNSYRSMIGNKTRGNGCPYCGESKGEKVIREWLEKNSIRFKTQYEFDNLKGISGYKLRFDFAIFNEINSLKLLIEYDGEFHYKKVYEEQNYELMCIYDEMKNRYCKKNNIELIRIPYWEFENIEELLVQLFKLHNKNNLI